MRNKLQRRGSAGKRFLCARKSDYSSTFFPPNNVLTQRGVVYSRCSRKIFFSFFFFPFGDLSDGTRAQIACPPAAAGGDVGAERAGNDAATNQTRGETLKHKDGMETKSGDKWPLKPNV